MSPNPNPTKRKYSEKAKKRSSTFFETCEVKFFVNSETKNLFPRRMSESAYRHLFCYKKPWPKQSICQHPEKKPNPTQVCRNCGLSYTSVEKTQCSAWGKTCFACNKQNHFQRQCISSNKFQRPLVRSVTEPNTFSTTSPSS